MQKPLSVQDEGGAGSSGNSAAAFSMALLLGSSQFGLQFRLVFFEQLSLK
jgi:pyridoxal/pyridoxine/pyridoxamine kinase